MAVGEILCEVCIGAKSAERGAGRAPARPGPCAGEICIRKESNIRIRHRKGGFRDLAGSMQRKLTFLTGAILAQGTSWAVAVTQA